MPCDYCGAATHPQERCFDRLQVERAGKCSRCDLTGHYWRKCPNLATIVCSFCKARGHTKETCVHLRKAMASRRGAAKDDDVSAADQDTNWRTRTATSEQQQQQQQHQQQHRQQPPHLQKQGSRNEGKTKPAAAKEDENCRLGAFGKLTIDGLPNTSSVTAVGSGGAMLAASLGGVAATASADQKTSSRRANRARTNSSSLIASITDNINSISSSRRSSDNHGRSATATPNNNNHNNSNNSNNNNNNNNGTDTKKSSGNSSNNATNSSNNDNSDNISSSSNSRSGDGNRDNNSSARLASSSSANVSAGGSRNSEPSESGRGEDKTASFTLSPDGRLTIQADMNTIQELLLSMVGASSDRGGRTTSDAPDAGSSSHTDLGSLRLIQAALRTSEAAKALFRQSSDGDDSWAASARDPAPSTAPGSSSQARTVEGRLTPQNTASAKSASPEPRWEDWADISPLTEENYIERLELYYNDIWPTLEPFKCPRCQLQIESFCGVVLKNCMVHKTCRDCLVNRILESPFKEVTCPQYGDCGALIRDEEVMELLKDRKDKELYEQKPLRENAEGDTSLLQSFMLDYELVPNVAIFECPVCLEEVPPLEGVMPKNCGEHQICKDCLRGAVNNSETPFVSCPAADCEAILQDREVQLLVSPEEYQALLEKGLNVALAKATPCRTPDCNGRWFVSTEGDGRFNCPVCNEVNCTRCKVIHVNNQSCKEYQAELAVKRNNERSEEETKAFLEKRLQDGFAMVCPECNAIVEKVDGCDGILCTVCRTELCWATKGRRWGPGGKGDWQGGGCRCWVGGKKCAPHCQNCH